MELSEDASISASQEAIAKRMPDIQRTALIPWIRIARVRLGRLSKYVTGIRSKPPSTSILAPVRRCQKLAPIEAFLAVGEPR